MTIDQIKARYPLPRSAAALSATSSGEYCCGGAIMMSQQPAWPVEQHADCVRFPDAIELALVLRQKNPALPEDLAFHYASTIVRRNDMGLFDDAWFYAGQALKYTPKED